MTRDTEDRLLRAAQWGVTLIWERIGELELLLKSGAADAVPLKLQLDKCNEIWTEIASALAMADIEGRNAL